MTNDELEAVRARAEAVLKWGTGQIVEQICAAETLARTDIPALLGLVENYRETLAVEQDRATRAEAHAERLAGALGDADGALAEAEAILGGEYADQHAALFERITRLRQALSAYRGEMKTVL